jgi:Ca-activated chloride channel family protein
VTLLAASLGLAVAPALAQDDQPAPAPVAAPVDETTADVPTGDGAAKHIGDPFDAYAAGAYDQALQGFVDRQVERPEDVALTFNIGNAHYQMKNYAEAENAFAQVAMTAEKSMREQALYNLGNCAFRQGKLEQAVELYMAALDIDPDDEDAKFNLEFVRDEIRRRHEEAQKRQEQQQQQQQGEQQQQQPQEGEQQQPQQGGQGQSQPQPQEQDSDRDGLPDQVEREGANPTDPHDSDSDDDGLLDGQEDRNLNGQVDEGETDPNDPDSDDDGLSDGEEALQGETSPEEQQGEQGEEGEQELSEEEAERYLQSLEEGRPQQRRPGQRGRPRRPEKDW